MIPEIEICRFIKVMLLIRTLEMEIIAEQGLSTIFSSE